MLAPEMEETMARLVKIEVLAEELESLRVQNLQYNERKEKNRECLGAFRRAEIPLDATKMWYTMGGNAQVQFKLPRKNAVQVIEAEQAKLLKLIDEARASIKNKTRELLTLQPNLTEMDPYCVELLLRERKVEQRKQAGRDSDDSDSN